jgi:hypothetical protein
MKPQSERWQIACINWTWPVEETPHAMAYRKTTSGEMSGYPTYFRSQAEAVAFVDRYIRIVRRFVEEARGPA